MLRQFNILFIALIVLVCYSPNPIVAATTKVESQVMQRNDLEGVAKKSKGETLIGTSLISNDITLGYSTREITDNGENHNLNLQNIDDVQGFVHEQSAANGYEWPTDAKVLEKLDQWQDLKFGVMFHWGLYSIPGIVESWSICGEDESWIGRNKNMSYSDYKKWYWGLKDAFNPLSFEPEKWAEIMKDAGCKYMVFTTKHHDGFCNFDSKYTDFTIANTPFGKNPKMNIAYHVFDAFRQQDFMVGCYFSKPDWHCKWFWNPYFPTANRGINYRKKNHPDWWKNYVEFTQNQLKELTTDYGNIDILWLDGGWITGDDIGLDDVLVDARKRNPGLISVDRTIKGRNENYQTPERKIPEEQLPYPWESCITLTYDWGWTPREVYKSSSTVVGLLAEVVAKGGSLLLGVGPTPDGRISEPVQQRVKNVGTWLKNNGEAIYGTRITSKYVEEQENGGKIWFTAAKDGSKLYGIYVPAAEDIADVPIIPNTVESKSAFMIKRELKSAESKSHSKEIVSELPTSLTWTGNLPAGKIKLLSNGRRLRYKIEGEKVVLNTSQIKSNLPFAFSIEL